MPSHPPVVDGSRLGTAVRAVEDDDLAAVAVGFEVRLQIVLRAAGLREDEGFLGGTDRRHLLEADLEGREECLRLCIYPNTASPLCKSAKRVDLIPQFLAVNLLWLVGSLLLIVFVLGEDLIEEVGFYLLIFDELLGEVWVVFHSLVVQSLQTLAKSIECSGYSLR